MHNWSLLLLAFVAVLQPIASFTERNLFDGRRECSNSPLRRDAKLSFHGSDRFVSSDRDRRFTYRDESRRYEVRNSNARIASKEGLERARDFGDQRSEAGRSNLQRLQPRDHVAAFQRNGQRSIERETRYSSRIAFDREPSNERTARTSRDVRQSDRDNREYSTERMSRDEHRTQPNDYRFKVRGEARRETRRARDATDAIRRAAHDREARINFSQSRDEVARDNTERNRLSAERRMINNDRVNERRVLDRESSERRSLNRIARSRSDSENREGVRNFDFRRQARALESESRRVIEREERRRDSVTARAAVRRDSRQQERVDSRRERDMARSQSFVSRVRESRASRAMSEPRELTRRQHPNRERMMSSFARSSEESRVRSAQRSHRFSRRVENRRDERNSRYMSVRDDNERLTRMTREVERRDQRAKVDLTRSYRQESKRGIRVEVSRERTDRMLESRMKNLALERDSISVRSRVDVSRNRDTMAMNKHTELAITEYAFSWQYVIYALQGLYLTSVILKMMREKGTHTKKTRSLGLWESSKKLLKVE